MSGRDWWWGVEGWVWALRAYPPSPGLLRSPPLRLRGKKGCWPVITSEGVPAGPRPLVGVEGSGAFLERLVVLGGDLPGDLAQLLHLRRVAAANVPAVSPLSRSRAVDLVPRHYMVGYRLVAGKNILLRHGDASGLSNARERDGHDGLLG